MGTDIREQVPTTVRACREDFDCPPNASHLPGS